MEGFEGETYAGGISGRVQSMLREIEEITIYISIHLHIL